MDSNYSLSDIAAATGEAGGFGGNGNWLAMIFLFALIFGFGGGGFGARGAQATEQPVTEAGLCNAMNFNGLENAVGRLNDLTQQQTMQLGNGICNLGYEMSQNISGLGKEVALGQANLQMQQSNSSAALSQQLATCCCTTQRAIDGVNYNNAMSTASINANIDAKFAALEKSQLEQRIAQVERESQNLYLAQQMVGVVRYPMSYAYSAGASPFCGTSCCGSMV